MDIYLKKAIEDMAKAQAEANRELLEESRKQTAWLAHMASLLDAKG